MCLCLCLAIETEHKNQTIMRILSIIILYSSICFTGFSQESKIEEKEEIKNVINQFFKAIEKKDSILMRSTILGDAQVWRRRSNNEGLPKIDFRFSKDSTPTMSSWPDMKEIALDYDITTNNEIAVAWIPYEFWIDDKFSHCGIDVFTLFKKDGEWKIITLAYTVEKVNCNQINRKN